MMKIDNINIETDLKLICEDPDNLLVKPAIRYNQEEIAGKDGSDFEEIGYSFNSISLKFTILDLNKIDEVFKLLDGRRKIYYKGRYCYVRFYSEINLERVTEIKKFEIDVIKEPFWFLEDNFVLATDNKIFNLGNINSKPLIKLVKNNYDTVDFTINEIRLKYNFDDDNEVTIDTKNYKCYCNNINKNRQLDISFEMPFLVPGENSIIINDNSDADIYFKNKDRFL